LHEKPAQLTFSTLAVRQYNVMVFGPQKRRLFGCGKHVRVHWAGHRRRANVDIAGGVELKADHLTVLVNNEIATDDISVELELGSRQRTGCR
jgi:hypothetical protein